MSERVGCEDMIAGRQLFGDPVPVAAMVAAAVDEQQRRGAAIAPIDIVKLQPLRDEAVRGGAGTCHRIILAVCSSFKRRLVSIRQTRLGAKIGRESCRERVWTYVEISVGAVL